MMVSSRATTYYYNLLFVKLTNYWNNMEAYLQNLQTKNLVYL